MKGYCVPAYGAKRGSGRSGEPARILKQIDLKEVWSSTRP
jgi:hypothetical protein